MSGDAPPLSQRAAQLRRDFDRSFAEPPVRRPAAPVDLLAIRLGIEPYALRLDEVAGLFAGKTVTRLPDSVPEFLGVAGFRGGVVPVYDLRVLLGQRGGGEAPRWLVIAAAGAVALAFDGFDGQLRLAPDSITQPEPGATARPHVRGLARTGDGRSAAAGDPLRPIVDLATVLEAIEQRANGAKSHAPTPTER